MKNIIKIIVIILIIGIIWFIYTLFNGNPFEKSRIKKELSSYLAEKYPFETVVRKVSYSFKLSTIGKDYYDARAYLKSNPDIEFNVYPYTKQNGIQDYLMNAIWDKSLEDELIPYVKINYWAKFKLITNVINDKFTDNYVSKSEIPNVHSILEQPSGELEISVYMDKEFDNDQDYQKMYQFIDYLSKVKNIHPKSLLFWFKDEQKQINDKEFVKNFIRFELTEKDIRNITNQNDLLKFKD